MKAFLLKIADKVLVGGAVANVFLKAQGRVLSNSFIEDIFVDEKRRAKQDWVLYAKNILQSYGDKIVCPEDLMTSDGISTKVVNINAEDVPAGWVALDIGPKTQKSFSKIIEKSAAIFLAGPMGKFEDEKFAQGSQAVLSAMKDALGETIIAGGDTIDAAKKYGNLENYSHVSLAGGATLEFLAGKQLPALIPLVE